MNPHSKRQGLFCSAAPAVLVVALIAVLPGSALAQTVPTQTPPSAAATDNSGQSVNADATDMSEIVVTARKKSETLLEVPLAITAMSAIAMEKKGVDDLLDVANYTPSLNITNFGNSSTNRGSQTVIVRGMVPGSTYLQTTTVFVNGAPLAASGIIDGISDVAQVEIIKGPQSAYFGRSTFGGAVNIITKAPGDDFKVSVDATYGSYNWTDLKASVEGAIIPGILSARITGRYYQTDGAYSSPLSPGYKYGAQESKNIMGELKFTPVEGLTIRAFGAYVKMDDGYQSFVKFPASTFNCTPTTGGISIICGTLPMIGVNSPNPDPIPASFISQLDSPANAVRYKSLGLDHGGSATQVRVGTLNISYDLPGTGVTLSSVTAANDYFGEVLTDNSTPGSPAAIRQPGIGGTYNGAFNQEFRATSDQDKRLRGSVGVNYSYLHRGGTGASISAPGYIFTVSAGGPFNKHKTYGIFGSASLDVTDQLILNVEGRYQTTKTVGYVRTLVSGEPVETPVPGLVDKAKEFLPRAIVQYKFAPRHQLFATYAKGANPGIFNTAFVTYSPALQQYLTNLLGGGLVTKSEHITSYELGYKGEWFDNRLQVDVGAYLSQWRDQVIVQGLRIVNPALTGIPGTLATNMYSNQGASDLKGVEGNFYYRASPALTISGGGSINDTKIIRYANTNSAQLLGYAPGTAPLDIFAGNQLAYGSKYSANVSLDYTREISSKVDGYFHADAFYKSGQYGEPGNFYKTPDTKRVNLRIGANYEKSKVELFVENVFDNRAYLSASPAFDQTDGNRLIAAAVLPTPRRFGVRFHTEY
jgi:iron complex outermembrane receptor protein